MKTAVVLLIVAAFVSVSFQSETYESDLAGRGAEISDGDYDLKDTNRRWWGGHRHTSGDTVSGNYVSNFQTGHNSAGNDATGLING
ncbi:hypothetical protein HOLleu_00142 [Holothuria leucospilota]|uniref:Uncharacterized protein n=1 Tax=Holothuria leucospilota TaxID=206669 RepID=A0A9Q1HFM8_HOLLE|nr:hypothetical protein HOLleu_00142 [Holothuria leucospilota]